VKLMLTKKVDEAAAAVAVVASGGNDSFLVHYQCDGDVLRKYQEMNVAAVEVAGEGPFLHRNTRNTKSF